MNERDRNTLHVLEKDWSPLRGELKLLLKALYTADCDAGHGWSETEAKFTGLARSYSEVRDLGKNSDFAKLQDKDLLRRTKDKSPKDEIHLKEHSLSLWPKESKGRVQLCIRRNDSPSLPNRGLSLPNQFWASLIGEKQPVVFYSVNTFRQTGAKNSKLESVSQYTRTASCIDWHTGIGELTAACDLVRVMSEIGSRADILPFFATIPPDRPLIWLGSSLVIEDLPSRLPAVHFEFRSVDGSAKLKWTGPKHPGDYSSGLKHSTDARSYGVDFASVAVWAKPRSENVVASIEVVLAGITPFGTGGAGKCLTDPAPLMQISKELKCTVSKIRNFEALLEVTVERSSVKTIRVLETLPLDMDSLDPALT